MSTTPIADTSLYDIDASSPLQGLLGGISSVTDRDKAIAVAFGERELSREELLPLIYGPLDLSKVKLSRGTLRNYLEWEQWRKDRRKWGVKGNKHYMAKRVKYRIKNYKTSKIRNPIRDRKYFDRLRERYNKKVLRCKQFGPTFNIPWEYYEENVLKLGMVPGTDIPYWKMTSPSDGFGFKVTRTDTSKGFEIGNVTFLYNKKVIGHM